MKFLIVGDWHSELHEEAVAKSLEGLNHQVEKFGWHQYFKYSKKNIFSWFINYYYRAQNKYLFGGQIRKINEDLLCLSDEFQPEVIFIYRGTHIFPRTLKKLKITNPKVILVGYNNDDPFASGHVIGMWRNFIDCLPLLDLALAYRHANLKDFSKAGAKRVELLRSWYIPSRNYPITLSKEELGKYECDVVFIGHFEYDERLKCIEAALNAGYKVKLYGPNYEWDPIIKHHPKLSKLLPVRLVWGKEYNLAICGAKVALVFLSKLNRDTYTRRNFEIPATGTLMFSEFTEDLASLFKPDIDAMFFNSVAEFSSKLEVAINDEKKRKLIADSGLRTVQNNRHSIDARMDMLIKWIKEIKNLEYEYKK